MHVVIGNENSSLFVPEEMLNQTLHLLKFLGR